MLNRRNGFLAAGSLAVLWLSIIAWAFLSKHAGLGGNIICASDAGSAQLFGAPGPGMFTFDLSTGKAVPLPASMAYRQFVSGFFKAAYSGQSTCALTALKGNVAGIFALSLTALSLLGIPLSLLVGIFARGQE